MKYISGGKYIVNSYNKEQATVPKIAGREASLNSSKTK